MRLKKDALWKYAPVWAVLFSTGAALFKKTGERYLLQREWDVSWSDVGTAAIGALVGYGSFRYHFGNKTDGLLTR